MEKPPKFCVFPNTIELYDHMGLSYLSMDISEIENEVANWEKLKEAHA